MITNVTGHFLNTEGMNTSHDDSGKLYNDL